MLEILTQRDRRDVVSYDLFFYTTTGSGFIFPCDKDGEVDLTQLKPEALANYHRCEAGEFGVGEVQRRVAVETTHATGRCDCGRVLTLRDDQACECGRMYNSFGQELTRLGYQDLPGEDY